MDPSLAKLASTGLPRATSLFAVYLSRRARKVSPLSFTRGDVRANRYKTNTLVDGDTQIEEIRSTLHAQRHVATTLPSLLTWRRDSVRIEMRMMMRAGEYPLALKMMRRSRGGRGRRWPRRARGR